MTITLIGQEICVAQAANATLVGLQGKIIDESAAMLTLTTEKGMKRILKKHATFALSTGAITGTAITGRLSERLKRS